MFPMSLMDNVLYGIDKDVFDEEIGEFTYNSESRQKVSHALKIAGLPINGVQNSLGLELDTRVGEGGRTLSGGQRQVSLRVLTQYNDIDELVSQFKNFHP